VGVAGCRDLPPVLSVLGLGLRSRRLFAVSVCSGLEHSMARCGLLRSVSRRAGTGWLESGCLKYCMGFVSEALFPSPLLRGAVFVWLWKRNLFFSFGLSF